MIPIPQHCTQLATSTTSDDKLRKLLELFPALPDSALVPIKLIQLLSGRGITSIRRDIAAGKLCTPVHIGPNCSRWPVGAVRQYLAG